MSLFHADLASCVITSGQQAGSAVGPCDDATAVTIFAPSTLTGTIRIQASQNDATRTAGTWVDVKSAGSNITVAADGAVTVIEVAFRWLRLFSGSAEGATRTFGVRKQFDTG